MRQTIKNKEMIYKDYIISKETDNWALKFGMEYSIMHMDGTDGEIRYANDVDEAKDIINSEAEESKDSIIKQALVNFIKHYDDYRVIYIKNQWSVNQIANVGMKLNKDLFDKLQTNNISALDNGYECTLKGGKKECRYKSKDYMACVLLRKCIHAK